MTTSTATTSIDERLERVRERVARACQRAGRPEGSVTIVGVSKSQPVEVIASAWAAGLRDFGENRVQEAEAKIRALAGQGITPAWHLVGHLQANKVRAALDLFELIHSVDTERLLRRIDRLASAPVGVLVQVNVSGETTKFGIRPAELPMILDAADELQHVHVRGLMAIAPVAADPEDVRPVFRTLRDLADRHHLRTLSMGMTDDFEVAIEEGATHVRIGRAIFGERSA